MNNIKDSIVANGGSEIRDASINKNFNVKKLKRGSFWKGFLSGVIASLIANLIWHFIQIFFN